MEWALLHPELAPALLLGALPLVIHLISKRQARELRFAAMEFVLRSQRRTARRLQIRQWLLLLARTLLILAMVVAVMGPVRRHGVVDAAGNEPLRHVFVVDLSRSMQAVVDGKERWKAAVALARKAVDRLPASEPVAVVACSSTPTALLEPPSFDRAAAVAALDQMQGTLEAGELPPCLVRARAALGAGSGAARMTIFSDVGHHAWDAKAAVDVGPMEVAVVKPDGESPANHALASITVNAAPEAGARGVAVEFEVESFGHAAGENVEAHLVMDGRDVARMTVELAGAGPWRRKFTTQLLPTEDANQLRTLEVALAPDALTVDDALSLPVRVPRDVDVLVMDGDPQSVAWRDEVFYLERALAQVVPGGGSVHQRVVTQAPTPQELEGVDVVMLCNVKSLPAATVQALDRFVRAGGGLFISGGDKLDVDAWNSTMAELLPQPLRGEKSRTELQDRDKKEALTFSQVAVEHPIFAPFNGQQPEGLMRAQTGTFLLLEPSAKADREVLLRFSNEAPALLDKRVGNGRVLLLTTSVDRDWSDLAIRPGFLPLMQQAVLYLANALPDGRPRHVLLGEARPVPVRKGVQRVAVLTPSGARHDVVVRAEETQVVLPAALEVGMHSVEMAPGDGELVEVPSERFAVWTGTNESDLTPLSDDELQSRMPKGARLMAGGSVGPRPEEPMWPLFLVALQLLLLAEAILAQRG